MELFYENGHLTPEGLNALVDGQLDEMARLEAAEHLSFCDECLVRYTALVEQAPLAAPETPLAPGACGSASAAAPGALSPAAMPRRQRQRHLPSSSGAQACSRTLAPRAR